MLGHYKVAALPLAWTVGPPFWSHVQVIVKALPSLFALGLNLIDNSVHAILTSLVSWPDSLFYAFHTIRASKIFSVTGRRALNPTRAACCVFLVVRVHYVVCICLNYLFFHTITLSLF